MNKTCINFPSAYPQPSWLSDWRDDGAYEDHGDDLDAWGWECLRRNPEYQADYARWAALPDTEIAEDGQSIWSAKTRLNIGEYTPMAFCHGPSPARSPEETAREYEGRTGIWPDTLYVHLCQRWGMLNPIDPASDSPPDWHAQGEVAREMPPYNISNFDDTFAISGWRLGYEENKGRLLFAWWPEGYDKYLSKWAFDLRLNIDDQVDLVRDLLKEMQAEAKCAEPVFDEDLIEIVRRPSAKGISTLRTDLRILDAKWSGASNAEIVTVLFGETKNLPYDDGGQYEATQRKAMEQKIKDSMRRITERVIEGGWGDLVRWSFLPQSQKNKARKSSSPE